MRIGVMGSGAVGGYFGAKLAAAGHQVAFIARGEQLKALRANGLRIESPDGALHIRDAQFAADAEQVGNVDLILFCVKSYDTESAGAAIGPMVSDRTTIVSLQNGIDNPDKLARLHGASRIIAAVVYIGAQVAAPGVVAHAAGGRIVFGAIESGVTARLEKFAGALTGAAIPCEASADIRQVQWTKLLWNAPFCAISCLTRANTKQIVESAPLTELALACMSEVQTAARSQGVELSRRRFDDTLQLSRSLGSFKPSMLQDLEARKPLEHEAFNGIVVKSLQAVGESAPVNQTFYAALSFLDEQIRTQTGV